MMILLLALAGGAGALLRYVLGIVLSGWTKDAAIPAPMLIVNTAGSYGLGLFCGLYLQMVPVIQPEDPVYLIAGVGFFGAFTTFSTFSVETFQLLRQKSWMPALWYSTLTIIGAVLGFLLGYASAAF
ncbi:fluoride efflux transporter CrcB [Alkalicoccus urumqiensis]|nr:fluoride efflux transporter CrcB [Alkalicoccus urumqiensis]